MATERLSRMSLESVQATSRRPARGQPDVSIIIVSWNTRDLLGACLASVVDLGCPTGRRGRLDGDEGLLFQIIVVDNGSTDGSPAMVREQFPMVTVIENRENVGFARANNQAVARSTGRYLLLLNPDTQVRRGAIETLVGFMDRHPEAGGAGPTLLNPDGTLQTSCYPSPGLAREAWRLFHLDHFRPFGEYPMAVWDRDLPRSVDVVQGACLILRRQAIDEVGPLDEGFFIYSEEVDLCYRLQKRGWTLHWVPRAEVVHYGGQSTRQVAETMFVHLYRSKIQYFRKHRGAPRAALYKLVLLLAALARVVAVLPCWFTRASGRERRVVAGHYLRLIRELRHL